jgi:hypothetical protein
MTEPLDNTLPLETWRQIMQVHPWWFWGIADASLLSTSADGCSSLTRQYAWQNSDAASRSELAKAIATAENILAEHLGYWPAPVYLSETKAWPSNSGAWGRWWNVQLTNGYIQAIGVEAHTLISAATAVTYTDTDGDGYMDTFTVGPIATTVTDPNEIALYFATADRFSAGDVSSDVGERWRIAPLVVTLSGGNVMVRGPAWLLIKPITYEGVTNVGANGLSPALATGVPTHYATTVDLYRRWTNPDGTTNTTSQGAIVWETRPCHGWYCCCDGCSAASQAFSGSPFDPAATAVALARVGIRDALNGIVSLGEAAFDTTSGVWSSLDWTVCDVPDRVVVRTLAGYPLGADSQMARIYQTVVARLAAAELARPICGCADANRELYRWQFDVARTGGANDEIYGAISAADLDNPIGTRRGHIAAWRFIRDRLHVRGFLL